MMGLMVALTIFILGVRIAESQTPSFGDRSPFAPLPSACRALLGRLSGPVLERLGGTFLFAPQADGGGGDGGGDGTGTGTGGTGTGGTGDGGSGTGTGSSGDGTSGTGTGSTGDGAAGVGTGGNGSAGDASGTGEGNSGDSASNGDGPSADPGAVGAPSDQGDPGNTEDAPPSNAEAPPDPSAVTDPTDPTAVLDVAKSDPVGSPGIAAFPTVSSGLVPEVDVGINAVIVSGARTPWEAIGKSSGVRYVRVTGGIIALGEAALAKPPPVVAIGTADNPPEWLKFKPDLHYLNGSIFPPVVPNVIDIRTISSSEEVVENPSK